MICHLNKQNALDYELKKQEHSDIGLSAYFAKLGKEKVNEEKEIEKHRKSPHGSHLENGGHLQNA